MDYNKVPVPTNHDDRCFMCILLALFALSIPFIFVYFMSGMNPVEAICHMFNTIKEGFSDPEFWKWLFYMEE